MKRKQLFGTDKTSITLTEKNMLSGSYKPHTLDEIYVGGSNRYYQVSHSVISFTSFPNLVN